MDKKLSTPSSDNSSPSNASPSNPPLSTPAPNVISTDSSLSVRTAIRERRATRHYADRPLPAELLEELVQLSLEAPSAFNLQLREIMTVTGEKREALSAAAMNQQQIKRAPATLVFLAKAEPGPNDHKDIIERSLTAGKDSSELSPREELDSRIEKTLAYQGGYMRKLAPATLREHAIRDASLSAGFALIAAQGLGLVSSPMSGFHEDEVKKVLGIEDREDLIVTLLLSVGFPEEDATPIPHPGRQENRYSQRF